MKGQHNARLLLILSMTIWGTLGIFTRNIEVTSGELALYRALLAMVFLMTFLLITKQKIAFAEIKKEIPLLLASGVAMGFNWILLFEAYKYTTISLATLSYYFAPVLVMVVCPFLFKEKLTKKQILCFIMSTVGLILIIGVGDVSGNSNLVGILFGLGAATLYATVVLLNKFIKNVSGIPRTVLQFIAAIIVLVPYVAATSGCTLSSLSSTGWICLLTLGLVHTGIAYCMYFSVIKDLRGQEVAIFSYIDPLVAVILSVTILHEAITPLQILGGVLILGFMLWNEKNSAE